MKKSVSARKGAAKKKAEPKESPSKESVSQRRNRAGKILSGLNKLYPDADCALTHDGALELLVATILSAQSTDETVNKVTPVLFERFPTAEAIAGADIAELEEIVRTTGFFRQKAKNVRAACGIIVEKHGGRVPDRMEDLVELPGVARKTANVVLGTWFKKNEGFVVDTHIGRLAVRLGLTWRSKDSKDAVKIESDLMEIVPRDSWTQFGHMMIWHGRRVCSARKPRCGECAIAGLCPSAGRV